MDDSQPFSLNNLRIALFMGGPGTEAQVSRWSGEAVAKALRKGGADVVICDLHDTNVVMPENIDIVFDIIHGTFGEDGTLQSILEERHVPYTGAGVEGSRIAFDKILSKKRFLEAGIPTARFEIIKQGEHPTMKPPYVIKTPRGGSTIGTYIIKENDPVAINAALNDVAQYGDEILVEEFVEGRELTVGIVGEDVLPIIEIKAKEGRYDFNHKYSPGGSQHLIPAPLSPAQTEEIQNIAMSVHRALGLEVYSRIDMMLGHDGKVAVLEANTIPGMTETSLLPDAAAVFGLDFTALCTRIIELSLVRYHRHGSSSLYSQSSL
jgi:D-alanine-D-alanine ligase